MKIFVILGGLVLAGMAILHFLGKRETRRFNFDATSAKQPSNHEHGKDGEHGKKG